MAPTPPRLLSRRPHRGRRCATASICAGDDPGRAGRLLRARGGDPLERAVRLALRPKEWMSDCRTNATWLSMARSRTPATSPRRWPQGRGLQSERWRRSACGGGPTPSCSLCGLRTPCSPPPQIAAPLIAGQIRRSDLGVAAYDHDRPQQPPFVRTFGRDWRSA